MGVTLLTALTLFGVMFGAGFFWARALLPRADGPDHVALSIGISVVVFAVIAATGLVVPWTFAAHARAGSGIYVVGAVVIAVVKRGALAELRESWVLWLPFTLLFCFVTLFGLVQGDPEGTATWPGHFFSARVPMLPADHALPHRTAQFIQTRTSPDDDEYFISWSFWDRTPLTGLVAASTAAADDVEYTMVPPWGLLPLKDQNFTLEDKVGFWHAHVVGTLLNAAVVLAVGRLALSRFDRRTALLAATFAAMTPYLLVHTFFTWPKLLAAYFVLLHYTYWRERRLPAVVGGCASLAYLAHPLGLFYVAGTLLVSLFRRGWAGIATVASAALVVLPWQVTTMVYGAPSKMMTYPLGVTMVSPDSNLGGEFSRAWEIFREDGLAHALDIRLGILVDAFVPLDAGPFVWLSPTIKARWDGGLDWYYMHNMSLTGIVLFALVPAGVLGVWHWLRDSRVEVVCFLLVPFVGTLLYWGLDARGLGIDCYQPLAATMFVAVAGGLMALPNSLRRILIVLGIAESASVIWLTVYERGPQADDDWLVRGAVAPWVVVAAVAFLAAWRHRRADAGTITTPADDGPDEPAPQLALTPT